MTGRGIKIVPSILTSPNAVSVAMNAVLNSKIYSSQVSSARTTTTKVSVLSGDMVLNGQVSVRIYADAKAGVESANESKKQTQLARATPTADLLRKKSTGLKVGSKMIIKVDPEPGSERGGKVTPGLVFDKFSLQAVTESDDERYQLHETFAEEVLFVFGRRPRVWTLAGTVVNSADANYADTLIANYDAYYRGTVVVDKRARTFVFYEDVLIECTLLGLTVSRNAQIPSAVSASLTVVVHERGFIQQRSEDVSDPNLAQFLEAAQASLNDEPLPADDIVARKPSSADVGKNAAESSQRETSSNSEVAALEQEISAANKSLETATEDQADARARIQEATSAAALARAAGNVAEESRQYQIAADSEREANELESSIQEAAETLVSLESQLEEKKKELEEAAAKSEVETATAKAAATAEDVDGSDVVDVVVNGRITVVQSQLALPQRPCAVVIEVTDTSLADAAVTLSGGKSDPGLSYDSVEDAVSGLASLYSVRIDKTKLVSSGVQTFSSRALGRIL